jgi:LuxR family maltose regulon positive regulatory protein
MQKLLGQLPHETSLAQYVSQLLNAFDATTAETIPVATANADPTSHLPLGTFSQRELEILRLIRDGHSNQNIGERLFVSLSTVKWHNQNIFSKLDVQRRTEAVARALQLNLL